MSTTLYWLWLQEKLGYAAKTEKVLAEFDFDVKRLYECTAYPPSFSKLKRDKLADKSLQKSQALLEYCNQKGYTIVTPDSPEYPHALRAMPDFPCVLYMQGDFDFNALPMLAIVGARKATYYGLNVATRLSYSLAAGGVAVVSGGALGIDSAAHKGALLAGGKTVMVLGSGLDSGSLKGAEALRAATVQNGAVISEFAPQFKANRLSFPIRNRIIAALTLGTIVVQASVKSGSLITADFARQYGRDVYGVPGGIYNTAFQGVNELIRDGAGIVVGVEDVLENYRAQYPQLIDVQKAAAYDIRDHEALYQDLPKTKVEAVDGEIELNLNEKKQVKGLSPKTGLVYDSLETGPKHINEISTLTALSQAEVLSHLTSLELMDAVEALEGRGYRLC